MYFRASLRSVIGASATAPRPTRRTPWERHLHCILDPRDGSAALAAIGVCALVATAAPAVGGRHGEPGARHAGKTVTLRYYSVTRRFIYRNADGTVLRSRRRSPRPAGSSRSPSSATPGRTRSHAKKIVASSHTDLRLHVRRSARRPATGRARSAATSCCSSTPRPERHASSSAARAATLGATGKRRRRPRSATRTTPTSWSPCSSRSDARERVSRRQPRSPAGAAARRRCRCATLSGMADYRDVNRANWDERVAGARRLARLRRRALHRRPRVPERGRDASTSRGSATSRASTACTCSATSAPTPSRSRGSARA